MSLLPIPSSQFSLPHQPISNSNESLNFLWKCNWINARDKTLLERVISSGKISNREEAMSACLRSYDISKKMWDQKEQIDADTLSAAFDVLMRLAFAEPSIPSEILTKEFRGERYFSFGNFKECLANTAIYGWKGWAVKGNPLQLPLSCHLLALEFCTQALEKEGVDYELKSLIIEILPYVINHRDISAENQLRGLSLIKQHGFQGLFPVQHNIIHSLYNCIILDHTTPELQHEAASTLFSVAKGKYFQEKDRREAISFLPFRSKYRHVLPDLHTKSTWLLRSILQDDREDSSIRKYAAENLSHWLWAFDGDATRSDDCLSTIKALKRELLADPLLFEAAPSLFSMDLWRRDQNHPLVRLLLPLLKETLESAGMPLELTLPLAKEMPQATLHIAPDKNAMDLFSFMVSKIGEENHPLPLKEVYVKHLMSCYLYKNIQELIQQNFPSIDSPVRLLTLPCIQNHSTLQKAANEAMVELQKNQDALKSPRLLVFRLSL